jgi:hypothetical protein
MFFTPSTADSTASLIWSAMWVLFSDQRRVQRGVVGIVTQSSC